MCNVLHEIDPKDWLKIFGNDGSITRLLSKNGIFLIVEDHQIPHGEKAFQNGFIVLDTPELKKLFQISSADKNFKFSDARNDGRLKAHTIPQVHLASVTSETRKEALKELVKNSKEQIRLVRGLEQSYKNGKICGFWLHQLANAELSLSEF